MKQLAENLWLLTYPLPLLGADFHRNVTVIRLRSGALVIHSTAPFAPVDVALISELGRPAWLVDSMLHHDTFAKEGRAAFPGIPFLAPEGFTELVKFPTTPILPAPEEWRDELDALAIQGAPSLKEYVFFHRASRTLIVTDLVFHFGPHTPIWTKILLKLALVAGHDPGMSRPFKSAIKDTAAFRRSIATMLEWDFDRLIVGHGTLIETGAKQQVIAAFKSAGF
ncbi:MAG: hypothetical protein ABI615_11045 [Chthoniobacterales bacterium]